MALGITGGLDSNGLSVMGLLFSDGVLAACRQWLPVIWALKRQLQGV